MDLLLRFPDKQTSIEVGQAIGATYSTEGGFDTVEYLPPGVNISVIGEHWVDETLVPGWWVLIRVTDDVELTAVEPFIVWDSRNEIPLPENFPNRQYA